MLKSLIFLDNECRLFLYTSAQERHMRALSQLHIHSLLCLHLPLSAHLFMHNPTLYIGVGICSSWPMSTLAMPTPCHLVHTYPSIYLSSLKPRNPHLSLYLSKARLDRSPHDNSSTRLEPVSNITRQTLATCAKVGAHFLPMQ